MSVLEFLVQKRTKTLSYIQRLYEGKVHWMNLVHITVEDLKEFYDSQVDVQKRAEQWFVLGISMGPILQWAQSLQYLRAISQLMEEYDYHYSHAAVKGMKIIKSKALTYMAERQEKKKKEMDSLNTVDTDIPVEEPESNILKPVTIDTGQAFEQLQTPFYPRALDYYQIVFTLCDILTLIYRKFLDPAFCVPQAMDVIIKIDNRIRQTFFGTISKDMAILTLSLAKKQVKSIDTLFAAVGKQGENEQDEDKDDVDEEDEDELN